MLQVIKREINRLCHRPIYLVGMIIIPLAMAAFFVCLMHTGLPLKVPGGVVDLDHSQMSRQLVRSIDASELIEVVSQPTSYNEAMQQVQEGKIYGFYIIPEGFERDAVGGRSPQLSYYYNTAIFVPGSLMFKGFKTLSVTAQGALAETNLLDMGAPESLAGVMLQPITIQTHPMGNPWMNYSYYLSPGFIYGILELMIFLMTAFSITQEIKTGASVQWIEGAGGRIGTALVGKLLPQTVIFFTVGVGINALLFDYLHFPMHGSMLWMTVGMLLMVIASQAFAVIVCSAIPNPRLSMSVCALIGILALSLAAFSFPVQDMYGACAIFSWILPVRYYFLIYIDQALHGWALWYSRFYFIGMLAFPLLATFMAPLMKKALLRPVYVP